MNRTYPLVTLAVAALLTSATPSVASARHLPRAVELRIADASGDANGLNGQRLLPVDGTSTPVNNAAADITSVTFRRNDNGRQIHGFSVQLSLSGPPAAGTDYVVMTSTATPDCTTFDFIYRMPLEGAPVGYLWQNCLWKQLGRTGQDCVFWPIKITVGQASVTWMLPTEFFPDPVQLGTHLTSIRAETWLDPGPQPEAVPPFLWDATTYTPVEYRIGQ